MIRAALHLASVAAALCLLGVAAAQDDAGRKEGGLWRGTIGVQAVTVCINDDGMRPGAYYYDRHRKMIGLQTVDGKARQLAEFTAFDDPTGEVWELDEVGDTTLSGLWRGNGRSFPIALERTDYTHDDYGGACESPEFLEPRIPGSRIAETAVTLDGERYTRLDYLPGPQFAPDTIAISSIAIEERQAGDRLINRSLRALLPDGTAKSDFMDCMAMNIATWGWDGDFERSVTLELLTGDWATVAVGTGLYCGGAHPSFWEERMTFDRRTGEEIDPASWLRDGAIEFYDTSEDDEAPAKRPVRSLGPGLLALVTRHWPSDDPECRAEIDAFSGYDLGVARGGMIFKPNVPHVMMPCAIPVTLPWEELAPFLSDAGRAARSEFEAGR